MIILYKSKTFTRSFVGRVILRAPQYAHIPWQNLLDFVRFVTKKHTACNAYQVFEDVEKEFYAVCPVCLTVLEDYEETGILYNVSTYMPTFTVRGDHIYKKGHIQCVPVDRLMGLSTNIRIAGISGDKELDNLKHLSKWVKSRNGFKLYLEWIEKRHKPKFRFNPRRSKNEWLKEFTK